MIWVKVKIYCVVSCLEQQITCIVLLRASSMLEKDGVHVRLIKSLSKLQMLISKHGKNCKCCTVTFFTVREGKGAKKRGEKYGLLGKTQLTKMA